MSPFSTLTDHPQEELLTLDRTSGHESLRKQIFDEIEQINAVNDG